MFYGVYRPYVHLKMDNVDYLKKPPWNFFLHFFAIPSSSRHEKRCDMNNPDAFLNQRCLYQRKEVV